MNRRCETIILLCPYIFHSGRLACVSFLFFAFLRPVVFCAVASRPMEQQWQQQQYDYNQPEERNDWVIVYREKRKIIMLHLGALPLRVRLPTGRVHVIRPVILRCRLEQFVVSALFWVVRTKSCCAPSCLNLFLFWQLRRKRSYQQGVDRLPLFPEHQSVHKHTLARC